MNYQTKVLDSIQYAGDSLIIAREETIAIILVFNRSQKLKLG